MTAKEARELVEQNSPKLIQKAKQDAISEIKKKSEMGSNATALKFNSVHICNEVGVYLEGLDYEVKSKPQYNVLSISW